MQTDKLDSNHVYVWTQNDLVTIVVELVKEIDVTTLKEKNNVMSPCISNETLEITLPEKL